MQLYLDKSADIKPFLGIFPGVRATGSITYGVPVNTDTVTVNGNVFTKVAADPGATEFTTIAELTALINDISGLSAVSDGTIITITVDAYGTAGNAYTLTRAGTGTMAVSGATFSGGQEPDTSKDTLLDQLNRQATGLVNSIFNVSTFAYHTVEDERLEGMTDELFVQDYPVRACTSIAMGRAGTAYSQTDPFILKQASIIIDGIVPGGKGYDADKITYDAGYYTFAQTQPGGEFEDEDEDMPEELKLCTLILLAGLFNQRNNLGVSQYSVQGKTVVLRNELELKEIEGIIVRNRKNRSYVA